MPFRVQNLRITPESRAAVASLANARNSGAMNLSPTSTSYATPPVTPTETKPDAAPKADEGWPWYYYAGIAAGVGAIGFIAYKQMNKRGRRR